MSNSQSGAALAQLPDELRKSLPMMPWYPRDFLAATQGWSLCERGAYFLLLGAQWEMGALSKEPRELALIVGVGVSEFKAIWRKVRPKFEDTHAGLVNRRLEVHRMEALHRSQAARQAAQERWRRHHANGGQDAVA
jgi:uncharacterized protein YdaU (DUF1376 family)